MSDETLVLLVEDDPDTREMYVLGLELHGLAIIEAGTAAEALTAATARQPSAIVTDLSLPDMDGAELCRRLVADERTRHIPILALTGSANADDLATVSSIGARQVIVKPCPPDELAAIITGVLSAS